MIRINTVSIVEGHLYEDWYDHERTEKTAVFDHYVTTTGPDGVEYIHPQPFRRREAAQKLAGMVIARGAIDPQYWTIVEPGPSLEERLNSYADNEQMVRFGILPESDLYRGV